MNVELRCNWTRSCHIMCINYLCTHYPIFINFNIEFNLVENNRCWIASCYSETRRSAQNTRNRVLGNIYSTLRFRLYGIAITDQLCVLAGMFSYFENALKIKRRNLIEGWVSLWSIVVMNRSSSIFKETAFNFQRWQRWIQECGWHWSVSGLNDWPATYETGIRNILLSTIH